MNDLKKNMKKTYLRKFLALIDAAKEIPPEAGFYQDIQSAVSYVCDGLDGEDICRGLSKKQR